MADRLPYNEINALSDDTLAQLVAEKTYALTDVQAYKDEAEAVRNTDPVMGEQIALAAYRVGQLLPSPAPALGAWALGNAAAWLTKYDEAATLLRSARENYLAIGQTVDAARLSVGLVGALSGLLKTGYIKGDTSEVTTIVAQSVPILEQSVELRDRVRLASMYSNMAVGFLRLGEDSTSISYYDRALTILENASQPNNDLITLFTSGTIQNRALSLTRVNLLKAAKDDLQMAIVNFEQLAQPVYQYGIALFNLGALEHKIGNHTAAEELFERSETFFLSFQRDSEGVSQFSKVSEYLAYVKLYRADNGLVWQDVKDVNIDVDIDEKIERWLTEAGDFFQQTGRLLDYGRVLLLQNRGHQQKSEWAVARERLNEAVKISDLYGGHTLAWHISYQFAQIALNESNDETTAINHLYDAVRHIEEARERLTIEAQRTAVMQNKGGVYVELAQLLLNQGTSGTINDALAVLERGRGRVLAERLSNRLAQEVDELAEQDDPTVQSATRKIQSLMEALANAQRRLYQSTNKQDEQDGERGGANTMATIRQSMGINRQILRLVREIQYKYPRFARLSTIHPVSLSSIAGSLDAGTTLLFYQTIGAEVHGFAFDHNGRLVHKRLCTIDDVKTAIQHLDSLRRQLWNLIGTGIPLSPPFITRLLGEPHAILQTLYTDLLTPFADMLDTADHLVIVPDGHLFSVPFQALYHEEKYLIEQTSVSYCPSLTFLYLCRTTNRTAHTDTALTMGYDGHDRGRHLVHVYDEIDTVSDLFTDSVKRTKADATAEWFLHNAHRFNVIHLGSHAAFVPTDPHLSFVALCDRDLTSAEIAGLRLNAQLVTLSGCETARTGSEGREFISISGAFAAAGVPTLLVSQWVVGDHVASELMQLVYRALLEGETVGDALQEAQKTLIASSNTQLPTKSLHLLHQHPALWSPFIVVGDWTQSV